jgi:2-methylisocitrate lyase-like PEP mutase family enzyme
MLAHIAEIVQAVDLPVNADFESGYAHQPEAVAANVLLCSETGVAGLSIEDATGDSERPLYELPLAIDRIRASRAAIDGSASGVLLTARAECFLVGHADPLKESIRRLQAFAEAGADVLYAPGPSRAEDIKTIVREVSPKPVNVLVSRNIGLTVADLAQMGVRRISVGSTLARVAWTGFMHSAQELAKDGSFQSFEALEPYAEINQFLREDLKERTP